MSYLRRSTLLPPALFLDTLLISKLCTPSECTMYLERGILNTHIWILYLCFWEEKWRVETKAFNYSTLFRNYYISHSGLTANLT